MAHPRHHDHGERWQVASALLARPKSIDEIRDDFLSMGRRFGVFAEITGWPGGRGGSGDNKRRLRSFLERTLASMHTDGWVSSDESGRFELTDRGRREAETMLAELRRSGTVLRRLAEPRVVSLVTLVVHFALAAIKLPAAILSHSVGLLNDALDTLADGISSLLVYAGIRTGRERLASIVLLVFMGATGVLTAIQAIGRIVNASVPEAEPLAFIAIAASGLVCAALYLYQRFVGVSRRSVPLIAQAIDSRNHVLVAGGVAVGLVAAIYELPYVDGVVGLVVSGLILKGALELFVEVVRSAGGEQPDLSAYGFTRLERHRARSLVRWLLYQVEEGAVRSGEELEREAHRSVDFADSPSLVALGIADLPDAERAVEEALRIVRDRQLVGGTPLALTEAGHDELDRALARAWAGAAGSPVFAAVRALAVAVGAVMSFLLMSGLALGLRWAFGFLPDAAIVASRTVLAEPLGVPIGPADAALAAGALVVHAVWRIVFARIRHRRFPGGPDSAHAGPTGHRGPRIVTRLLDAVDLLLLTNAWWMTVPVVLQAATLVIRRLRGGGRRETTGPPDSARARSSSAS